ncbi:hypothetical protein A2U01_0001325, partial [Trifolium medium]|nr:hypothetical protein [Trifolium medium]
MEARQFMERSSIIKSSQRGDDQIRFASYLILCNERVPYTETTIKEIERMVNSFWWRIGDGTKIKVMSEPWLKRKMAYGCNHHKNKHCRQVEGNNVWNQLKETRQQLGVKAQTHGVYGVTGTLYRTCTTTTTSTH